MRQEFTRNWGPEQSLYSPMLVIPYQAGDRPRQYLKIAPARLDLAAELKPQERKRGLFHATVYDAKVDMTGAFVVPAEARLREFVSDKDGRFLWSEASIAFGAPTNLTGLRATDNITIDGIEPQWMPCLEAVRQEAACRAPRWCWRTRRSRRRSPAARACSSSRASACAAPAHSRCSSPARNSPRRSTRHGRRPSFSGNTLPLNSTVTADGFEANWQTIEFGSPRIAASAAIMDPAMWKGATIGVDLIEATPIYRMITRVAKYGLLFVRAVVRDLFLLRSAVAAADPRRAVRAARPLALAVLAAAALARRADRLHQRLSDGAGLVLSQSTLYTAAVARASCRR